MGRGAIAPVAPAGSLTGYTVGITADRRWHEQAALFDRRGATVIHGPTIRTLPLDAETPLRQATDDIIARPPTALIANTGVGIRSWFANADSWGVGRALETALGMARIYARGPKAAGAIHSAGLAVVARARTERLSEITDLVLEQLIPGQRVVLQLDGSWASAETARLRQAGAEVITLPVYRWTLPDDTNPGRRLAEAVLAGRVQAVTFTAGPAIRNWMAIAAEAGIDMQLRDALTDGRTLVGCVGPVCAEAAATEGLLSPHLVQPDAFRLGPLVRAITDRLTERRMILQLGPSSVVLSGTALLVAGQCISLTDIEARLLATLASSPGKVLTKEHLMRTVWAGTTPADHTVEAGISRLRKRLGVHGTSIRSVHRRGYTLRPDPAEL
jgi:uroporphyrinogen-III synthase